MCLQTDQTKPSPRTDEEACLSFNSYVVVVHASLRSAFLQLTKPPKKIILIIYQLTTQFSHGLYVVFWYQSSPSQGFLNQEMEHRAQSTYIIKFKNPLLGFSRSNKIIKGSKPSKWSPLYKKTSGLKQLEDEEERKEGKEDLVSGPQSSAQWPLRDSAWTYVFHYELKIVHWATSYNF